MHIELTPEEQSKILALELFRKNGGITGFRNLQLWKDIFHVVTTKRLPERYYTEYKINHGDYYESIMIDCYRILNKIYYSHTRKLEQSREKEAENAN